MYSLVASCLLASLAASGPQHQLAAEAFTPQKPTAPSARSDPGNRRRTAPDGSNGGCLSRSEDSANKLGVSAAPLELDASVDRESASPLSQYPNSPLTDEDIEIQLQNQIIQIRKSGGAAGGKSASSTASRAASSSNSKKKRRPRILRTGADGVGTIRVVDAPRPGRPLANSRRKKKAAGALTKDAPLRLTREEEAQISSAVRSLRSAVRVRDDLAASMGREPTENEWAEVFGQVEESSSGSVLDLRRTMHDGREARSRLVAANAGLVASMAKKYSAAVKSSTQAGGGGGVGSILTMQDLIQEGNLGLMEAAERFEPERGFRFSTYASHWVRQRMLRSIADYSRVIRLPAHVHSKLSTIRKARSVLEKDLGRPPTDPELAGHLDLPLDKLRLYAGSARNVLSLEAPTNSASSNLDDRRRALGDVIADSRSPTPEEDALSRDLRSDIRAAVYDGCLTDRERDVLVLRFGLEDGTSRSVGDAARELGLSRDRVRTVEARALNKLRRPGMGEHRLEEYVNGGGPRRRSDGFGGVGDDEDDDIVQQQQAAAAADYVVGSSPENLWSF